MKFNYSIRFWLLAFGFWQSQQKGEPSYYMELPAASSQQPQFKKFYLKNTE